MNISCGKALDDQKDKLGDLKPGAGAGAHYAVLLPPVAMEHGPGPENALVPDSALLRACSILGLGGWVVCHASSSAMLGFVEVSHRVSPGRLTEYAWDRPIQWAR